MSKLQNSLIHSQGKVMKIILGLLVVIVAAVISYVYINGGVASVVKQQLEAIKSGDIATAYALTSKAFQQQTSLDAFSDYLNKYPILKNYEDITFTEKSVGTEEGSLKGILVSNDGSQLEVVFTLVKEEGKWKVQTLNVSAAGIGTNEETASTEAISGPLSIHALLVSDSADADGYVTDSKATLSKSADKIYATVQIVSPDGTGKVDATLVEPDGTKVGPVTAVITKAGNIMKAYAFARAGNKWPTGNYTLNVNLSSGATKTINFSVN